jgi:hypothetical protein
LNTIQEQWEQFSTLVIPKNAPDIQKQEMRRAFYAGVQATLRIQFEIGNSSITEVAGVAMLEGLHEECQLFASAVARGEA